MPHPDATKLEDSCAGGESARRVREMLRVSSGSIDWTSESWPDFPQARDLCQRLLAFRMSDRLPSAAAALRHPWLQGGTPVASPPATSPGASPEPQRCAGGPPLACHHHVSAA